MISVGHLTASRHEEVSTSSLNGEDVVGRVDATKGGPYDTDRCSVLDGLTDFTLNTLSPKDPDFFLVKDCRLDLRLSDPNFSLSNTLLRRGDPSPNCEAVSVV